MTSSPARPASIREFRDLAVLLSVMHGLPDGDPKAAIERLQPLTASGNPWRASALDLTAAAKLKAGDRGGALRNLQDSLPTTWRRRRVCAPAPPRWPRRSKS